MLGYRPIFCIFAETPKMPREMYPPLSHTSKDENRQNQKRNMPNERSYQNMKKNYKNKHLKKLHP